MSTIVKPKRKYNRKPKAVAFVEPVVESTSVEAEAEEAEQEVASEPETVETVEPVVVKVKKVRAKKEKVVKEPVEVVDKPVKAKRKPSAYNEFVSVTMKTDAIKKLPTKERFREVARLWKLKKESA